MRRISIIVFTYIFTAAGGIYAQSDDPLWYFGAWGGYAHNSIYQGGVTAPATENEDGHGIAAGLSVRFMPLKWIGARFDPMYVQKNYGSRRIVPNYPEFSDTTTNHFLDGVFLAHFNLPIFETGFSVFANTGAYIGLWLASYEKGSEESPSGIGIYYYDEKYEFQDKDDRFDYGLAFGAGIQYNWSVISLFVEWRMLYALSDLRKKSETDFYLPLKNDTWTLHIGFLINSGIFNL
ncbi:MAG: PorT family protein [Spirochaetaceae bacterium]|jgi:hypothetical protein|nr:PorT family protein [Spirochaetaceae bacterium]GMO18524.1 MAG: porin family protein [Termitinemataceae bacterium]